MGVFVVKGFCFSDHQLTDAALRVGLHPGKPKSGSSGAPGLRRKKGLAQRFYFGNIHTLFTLTFIAPHQQMWSAGVGLS
jgi:hypothetical protein